MHPVRPCRAAGRQPPAGASADHAAAGLGRARPGRDHRACADLRADRRSVRPERMRGHSPRSASATSARRPWCGTGGRADRSIPRSCGRTRGRRTRSPGWRPRRAASDRFRATDRVAGLDLFERAEAALDPRSRSSGGRDGLAFGTIDSWVLWQLTGGVDGGVHATDVTNASRTMLMGLETLDWDDGDPG